MPPPGGAVVVGGLQDLQRAFRRADKTVGRELKKALADAAMPVKVDAERNAVSRIRNVGPKWSQMRIGSTQRMVYVAPKQRGRASKRSSAVRRPNLKDLLLDRAMEPALAENQRQTEQRVQRVLDTVAKEWER
jgi:hypothetical protein